MGERDSGRGARGEGGLLRLAALPHNSMLITAITRALQNMGRKASEEKVEQTLRRLKKMQKATQKLLHETTDLDIPAPEETEYKSAADNLPLGMKLDKV